MFLIEIYDRKGFLVGHFGSSGVRRVIDCLTLPLWDDQSEALAAVASMPPEWLERHTIRTSKLSKESFK